jgi:hypothetical protein
MDVSTLLAHILEDDDEARQRPYRGGPSGETRENQVDRYQSCDEEATSPASGNRRRHDLVSVASGRVAVALEAHPLAVGAQPPGPVPKHVVPVLAHRTGSVVNLGSRALDQSAARSVDPSELGRVQD